MASKPAKPPAEETLDRVRRIETRLTTLCIGMGIDTPQQKPVFDPGSINSIASLTIPSMDCSMKQIRASVPHDWKGPVRFMLGNQYIGQLDLKDRT